MFIESETGRRRATRDGVVVDRAARRMLSSYSTRIAQWNGEIARLGGLKTRDARLVTAPAAKLLPLVIATRIELEAELYNASPKLAQCSLAEDVRHALERLRVLLEGLLPT